MKLHHLVLITAIAFSSCKNEQKEATGQETSGTVTEISHKAHKALYSPDWPGPYTGTTPCLKPCEGEKTKMTITADSTYTLSVQAIGQEDKPRVFTGSFYWDKDKNVITLDANGDHHKFEVQEGSLKVLDKFGDPKQLGKQEDYVLKKQ